MHYACDLNLVLLIGRLVKNEITKIYSHKKNTILCNTVQCACVLLHLPNYLCRKKIYSSLLTQFHAKI
jgi:hypothetical protein